MCRSGCANSVSGSNVKSISGMELSGIINLLLGGGLMATIAAIITLRSTVRKAKAEAEKALAEAEAVRIDNTEKATRVLIENIVEPLREELNETRKEIVANRRETARLRKAIDSANSCRYSDSCPVLERMRIDSKERKHGDVGEPRCKPPRCGQHGERRRKLANARDSADVISELDAAPGQSSNAAARSGLHREEGASEREGDEESTDQDGARANNH